MFMKTAENLEGRHRSYPPGLNLYFPERERLLLRELARQSGLSRSALIRFLLHAEARRKGIDADELLRQNTHVGGQGDREEMT